jgi:hypothetical protein
MMKKFAYTAFAIGLSLALVACDDHGHDDEKDPVAAVNEEGCEHLEKGPFRSVSAATSPTDAPVVEDDHRAYVITLPEVGEALGYLGYVRFDSDEEGDFVLFFNHDVTVRVLDADGNEVEIEDSQTSVPQCTVVAGRHQVELDVGSYFFELSHESENEVSLVVEHFEEDDDHDH